MFSSVVVEVMCLMAVLNGALLVIQLMLTYLCASFHLATFGKMSHTSFFFFYLLMLILIMGILIYYLETTKSLPPFLRGYCTYVAFYVQGSKSGAKGSPGNKGR